MASRDLALDVFITLRNAFFDVNGNSIPFSLRDKRNTQHDPFDELVTEILHQSLGNGASIVQSPGPLITPDIVLIRREELTTTARRDIKNLPNVALGIEVKKLERSPSGTIPRASGLDFNSTPPCGTVRVYDSSGDALDIRGFYLFICLAFDFEQRAMVTALAFVDGNALNADFDYYLSVTGARTKSIGLGTYGDGANRIRPMVIFSNPLGSPLFAQGATMIHGLANLSSIDPKLAYVGALTRTIKAQEEGTPDSSRTFYCYQLANDVRASPFNVTDPFPSPARRSTATVARGRFRLPVCPAD